MGRVEGQPDSGHAAIKPSSAGAAVRTGAGDCQPAAGAISLPGRGCAFLVGERRPLDLKKRILVTGGIRVPRLASVRADFVAGP